MSLGKKVLGKKITGKNVNRKKRLIISTIGYCPMSSNCLVLGPSLQIHLDFFIRYLLIMQKKKPVVVRKKIRK